MLSNTSFRRAVSQPPILRPPRIAALQVEALAETAGKAAQDKWKDEQVSVDPLTMAHVLAEAHRVGTAAIAAAATAASNAMRRVPTNNLGEGRSSPLRGAHL